MQAIIEENKKKNQPIILIVGVGGGGSNAVNYMYTQKGDEEDVAFAVVNTDAQALANSPVPTKIQIGPELTHGRGAGSNPTIGEQAALESKDALTKLLQQESIQMVFTVVCEGGGTGTGAGPIIAEIAKEQGKLTIGMVTQPFTFEGKKRIERAKIGTEKLRANCDTLLVILNEKLKQVMGNETISSAFCAADNLLNRMAVSITKIISKHGYINVDFADVRMVLQGSGEESVIGTSTLEGKRRASEGAKEALSHPFMDKRSILTAEKILLSIVSGPEAELKMDELVQITNYIQNQSGNNAEVIFGHGYDETLGKKICITIIATGFKKKPSYDKRRVAYNGRIEGVDNGRNRGEHEKKTYATAQQTPFTDKLPKEHNTPYRTKENYYKNIGKSLVISRKEGERYDGDITAKMDRPAYLRKGTSLVYNPPSEPPLISYNLYDDPAGVLLQKEQEEQQGGGDELGESR